MKKILNSGMFLIIVLGGFHNSHSQEIRKQLDLIVITVKPVKIFPIPLKKNDLRVKNNYLICRSIGRGISDVGVWAWDVYFFHFRGLEEFKENYNFPGYYKAENPF